MSYIYLDESGDLGFNLSKRGTSKYFIITFLITRQQGPVEKIIKSIHKEHKTTGNSISATIHAFKESDKIRQKVFDKIVQKDMTLTVITLAKTKKLASLYSNPQLLYNELTVTLLSEVVKNKIISNDEPLLLVASQNETNKQHKENFSQAVSDYLKSVSFTDFKIEIKPHASEKCLQVVDFVSWATFRKYERANFDFYEMLKEKIAIEKVVTL